MSFVFNNNFKLFICDLPPRAFSFANAGPYLREIAYPVIIIKYES